MYREIGLYNRIVISEINIRQFPTFFPEYFLYILLFQRETYVLTFGRIAKTTVCFALWRKLNVRMESFAVNPLATPNFGALVILVAHFEMRYDLFLYY